MRRLLLFIPFVICIGLGLFLWKGLSLDSTNIPSPLLGKAVPEFSLPLLREGVVTQEQLTGKVRLLNVWATWCISCRVEHPWLMDLAAQGVAIVGLNYKDEKELVFKWLADRGDPYEFIINDAEGTLGLDLGVYGAPETYLIDKQGVVRAKLVGVLDERKWQEVFLPLYQELTASEAANAQRSRGEK